MRRALVHPHIPIGGYERTEVPAVVRIRSGFQATFYVGHTNAKRNFDTMEEAQAWREAQAKKRGRVSAKPCRAVRVHRKKPIIYLIAGAGLVKVGRSSDAAKSRLRQFQAGCPVPLKVLWSGPGTHETELRLHRIFAADRKHGEWFDQSPALLRLGDLKDEYHCELLEEHLFWVEEFGVEAFPKLIDWIVSGGEAMHPLSERHLVRDVGTEPVEMAPACTDRSISSRPENAEIPATAGEIPYGAAKESNLPTAGLRRPAGFEDPRPESGSSAVCSGIREGEG
jgi:hypothetical protein